MAEKARVEKLEEGDIFLFYRPRVETEEVHGRADVQRLYMVLAPKWPKRIYRLFVIGRKKLPEVTRGEQNPERRNWALNVRTSTKAEDIRQELGAMEYDTATRGERFVPSAKPVGEGRYQIVRHADHTELVYALELPREPGPAQEEFDIKDEASFVISVKNPDVSTPGAPSSREPPAYPRRLRDKFERYRWIAVEEPELLDYENTQILLIGAHEAEAEEELGVRVDTADESLRSADVCRELRVSCARERVTPLLSGEFPEREEHREEAR